MFKISYYIEEYHDGYEDGFSFDDDIRSSNELAAEHAARHYWNKSGWEFMVNEILTFVVAIDGEEVGTFFVETGMSPWFDAKKKTVHVPR
jgi:hypothetical protein